MTRQSNLRPSSPLLLSRHFRLRSLYGIRRIRYAMKVWMLLLAYLSVTMAQDYAGGPDDYQYVPQDQDTLYHDYAARQENKAVANPGKPWGTILASASVGWFLGGKIHSGRVRKTLQTKHKQEQKALYQQYYQDVYSLQQQNADLVAAIEQMGVKIR